MNRCAVLPLILLIAVFVPLSASAQEDEEQHPLIAMLALIPDTPEVRQAGISYIDYAAIVKARLGELRPHSWAELYAPQAGGGTIDGLWRAALNGVTSGPSHLLQALAFGGEEMPDVVGFDIFAVTRGAEFLRPPHTVTILQGDFDAEAIAQAFSDRDYTSQDLVGMTLWCGPGGCDAGTAPDIGNVNRANPFGGQLGRNEPLLVVDDYLISISNSAELEGYAELLAGATPSLADAPEFKAAASAVTETGTLIQAHFYDASAFVPSNPIITRIITQALTAEGRAALLDQLQEEIEAGAGGLLPFYSVAVLADVVDGDEQVVLIGLVFSHEDYAQVAAEVLPVRMAEYQPLSAEQSLTELLETQAEVIQPPRIYTHEETGLSVTVIELRAPMPPPEPVEEPRPGYVASSLVFRLLIRMLYQRDMGWLAVGVE